VDLLEKNWIMRHFLIKNFLLPVADIAKGTQIRKQLHFYLKTLNWSREQVEDFQLIKLKKLLNHAYQNSDFYTKRFDEAGFNPDHLKSIDDLKKIRPLTRYDLQQNHSQILCKNHNPAKLYRGTSSGSTGEPVVYYHDSLARSSGGAVLYLAWQMAGWEFGMKGLHIWGNPRTVKVEWQRNSSKIKSLLFNIQRFPSYQLTDESKLDELVDLVVNEKFDYIDGYTNAIFLLAKRIKDKHISIKKLQCIMPTGETLHQYQRELINEILGPVYDLYGCGEIMGIAFQTKFNENYLIFEPHVVVEYDMDFQSDDNAYPLMITDLNNYSFPFIRYKNGDLAEPADIINKLPFNTLKRISGRTSDIIELPDGGNLSVPSFFGSKLLRLVKGIRQYQIEKVTNDKIIINLVKDEEFTESENKIITESLNEYLAGKINWEIKILDKIEESKTGKFKLVIDRTK
jgi:phenylacetate-CoA ligase